MRAAEQRAWEVVKRAYGERTPTAAPRAPSRRLAAALGVAVIGAVVAAILSPPGRAVFQRVREAVGIQQAEPALFSLPAHGRLLVVSRAHRGVWLAHDHRLKRGPRPHPDAQKDPPRRLL